MHKTDPNSHDWLLAEIAEGLQRLLCLSLDHAPAAETITGTARAWRDAIEPERDWDRRRDTVGIREAFAILVRGSVRWPAPHNFLNALPRLVTEAEINPPPPRDLELETLNADLAHFTASNKAWRERGHHDDLFDIHRCFNAHQRQRLGLP